MGATPKTFRVYALCVNSTGYIRCPAGSFASPPTHGWLGSCSGVS